MTTEQIEEKIKELEGKLAEIDPKIKAIDKARYNLVVNAIQIHAQIKLLKEMQNEVIK